MSEQSPNRFIDSLRLFVDIARLRRGPEDLPVDRSLLVITIIAGALLDFVLSRLVPRVSPQLVLLQLVETALTLLWLVALLQLAHKPERFLQTATAACGFQLVVEPFLVVAQALFARFHEDSTWQAAVALLLLVLTIWLLVGHARILMAATQWPAFLCAALVLSEAFLSGLVVLALFPQPGAATAA